MTPPEAPGAGRGAIRPGAFALVLAATAVRAAAAADTGYGAWHPVPIRGGSIETAIPCAADPARWYGVGDASRLYRSDDGGRHWRLVASRCLAPFRIRSVDPDPRDANRVLLTVASSAGSTEGVFSTQDGGGSWTQTLRVTFSRTVPPDLVRSPANPDLIDAVVSRSVRHRSIDGGLTWKRWKGAGLAASATRYATPVSGTAFGTDGIERLEVTAIFQDIQDARSVHVIGTETGARRSADAGETFTAAGGGLPARVDLVTASPAAPARLYAAGSPDPALPASRLYLSTDGGRQWQPLPMTGLPSSTPLICRAITVHPVRPLEVYAGVAGPVRKGGGAGGVYRSLDGGATWAWFGHGLPVGQGFFSTDPRPGGRELAVSGSDAVLALTRTPGGVWAYNAYWRAWMAMEEIALPVPATDLLANPKVPGFFLIAADGVYATNENGASWGLLPGAGRAARVAVDLAHPDRYAAGTDEGVTLSLDGAHTWQTLDPLLPDRCRPAVAFAGERILAGTAASGLYWMPVPTK